MAALTDLSERECEILRLVATGASNKEIAQRLVISPNTVKVHLRNIFAKIGVASRTEATLFAIGHGLVETSRTPLEAPATPNEFIESKPAAAVPVRRARPRWLHVALVFGLLGALALTLLAGRVLLAPASQAAAPVSPPALVRWSERPDLPAARAGAAGAAYENSLFLIGGDGEQGPSPTIWRYLPGQYLYEERRAKPHAVRLAQAALLGERIYVPGGQAPDGSATNRLEIYDPRLDAWSTGAELPRALYGYALAAQEGRLYLFGGTDGTVYSAAVYSYYPELDAWSRGADLPQPAAHGAAVATGAGSILLAGGLNVNGALDAVQVYYPQRHARGEPAWEALAVLPESRYGMGMAVLANAVYLMGGAAGPLDEGELLPLQYALQGDAWLPFDPSPQPAGLFPLLLPYETHLHLMGGQAGESLLSSHQAYQAIYTIWVPVQ